MKMMFAVMAMAAGLYACTDNASYNDSIRSDDPGTNQSMEDPGYIPPAGQPTTGSVYTPDEGDLSYRDDRLMIRRDGEWVAADADVTLDNGAVVYRDGRVKKEDKEVRLEDGEVVTKTGNFFDRTGQAIENAWDDVKKGAKKAGDEIERGANKAGDAIDRTFDGDKD